MDSLLTILLRPGSSRVAYPRTTKPKEHMLPKIPALFIAGFALAAVAGADSAFAHGFAGKRFFPTTLAVDDPFVSDELTLPTVSSIKEPREGDKPATRETELEGEYTKTLLPNLGVTLKGAFKVRDPNVGKTQSGFGNLDLGLKYQFLKSARHEAVASLGLDAEVGNTGKRAVGADSFSTLTPTLFFGKGFGDLPDGAAFLKPLAVTGIVGGAIPLDSRTRTGDEIDRNPHILQWGFTVQYSIPYLQSFVKDVGLRAPFNRLIPVVEGSFETPLDRGRGGDTTGTINPGVIWSGKTFQLGLEAMIPVNDRTGNHVGVIAQLHFFIDDIFPKSIGRPLFKPSLPSFGD